MVLRAAPAKRWTAASRKVGSVNPTANAAAAIAARTASAARQFAGSAAATTAATMSARRIVKPSTQLLRQHKLSSLCGFVPALCDTVHGCNERDQADLTLAGKRSRALSGVDRCASFQKV
jgi:hypothetical protein